MNWEYHDPKFEYEEIFNDTSWAWVGHKRFGYDLVRNLQPKKIVELGTHKGTSFFSFCQAIKDGELDTELYAVDTWQGDAHAGFYDDSVWKDVNTILAAYYSGEQVKLLRKTFDEALSDFENDSIDLLHIDGLHTYEAVKHDFESWLPKMKKNGVILFHDINVGEKDFGVYRLWNELKKQYDIIEFRFSHGLGVIFLGRKDFSGEEAEKLTMHYAYLHETKRAAVISELFGECAYLKEELKKEAINNERITNLQKQLSEAQQQLTFIQSSKFWRLRNLWERVKFSIKNPMKLMKKENKDL